MHQLMRNTNIFKEEEDEEAAAAAQSTFFILRMYVNACEEDGDRRPCTNVVNLFVNKCSPCLPLHPAHLDAKRRRRRRRKRSETFLPSSCLEAAPSKLTLTLPHHSLARSSLEDYSSNIYIPVCMCSMMMVLV